MEIAAFFPEAMAVTMVLGWATASPPAKILGAELFRSNHL